MVRLKMTFILTLVRALGTGTNAVGASFRQKKRLSLQKGVKSEYDHLTSTVMFLLACAASRNTRSSVLP